MIALDNPNNNEAGRLSDPPRGPVERVPMRIAVEVITPEDARWIQDASDTVTQRKLNPTHVHRLASAMKAGHWKLTHQAIALDGEGRLIDGQHRVAAIIEANMDVEMVVARGVDAGAFHVIDTGRTRNSANALQIAGIASAVVVSSAVKMFLKYEATKGTKRLWSNTLTAEITNEDVVTYATKPEGILLRGQQSTADYMLGGVGRAGARVPIMVALTLIRAAAPDNPDTVAEFIEKVATGSMLPAGSPILAYRRWLTNMYPQYSHHERGYAALIATLKTWRDWRDGKDRSVLSVRPGHEVMPDLIAEAQADLEREAAELVGLDPVDA
jgi:hypothetical protein